HNIDVKNPAESGCNLKKDFICLYGFIKVMQI
ncbi:MAG: hypothetical protein RIR48_1170, partial [Bacteroidota bacterium]